MSRPTYPVANADGADLAVLARTARVALDRDGIALLRRFPREAQTYIDFLGLLGEPLTYYGDTRGSHPAHPAIHRVHYDADEAARGELHAVDGRLPLHSAQSLRDPRPRLFSMLMVDEGWQGEPTGGNGETVLSRWSWALERLRDEAHDEFDRILQELRTPIPFRDGKVRSLLYALPDASSPLDCGVRLKYDLVEHLDHENERATVARIERLLQAAETAAWVFQLQGGDAILVDNNRWAHGRSHVRGQRPGDDGDVELNPRELWSVTLA